MWGLFLKKEFRKRVITTQTLTKSQEDIENELRGDFLVCLSQRRINQDAHMPSATTAVPTSRR